PASLGVSSLSLPDALPICKWWLLQTAGGDQAGGVALEDRRPVRIAEPAGVRTRAAMPRADERDALRRRRAHDDGVAVDLDALDRDRKSTRLNSSHQIISYA